MSALIELVLVVIVAAGVLVWVFSPIREDSVISEVGREYEGKCSWFKWEPRCALGRPRPYAKHLYCACRWDYDALAKELSVERARIKSVLNRCLVEVTNPANGRTELLTPVDWGPNEKTGRIIDISEAAMRALDASTDDVLRFKILRYKDAI